MEKFINKVHHGAFLNNELPDKSVQLIIADPPYFEVKGHFDFIWKSFDDYLKDVEKWAIECKRILADNGSLFWYGHAKKIAYTQIILDKYFNLENSLVWRKIDSMQYQYYSVELSRSFNTHNERLLFYSNAWDINGLKEIYGDENCFSSIKEYLRAEKEKSGFTNKEFNKLFSEYFNKQGCRDRSVIEHYWSSKQWVFPTKEIYENILQKTGYFNKAYNDLKNEYENEKFNLDGKVKEIEENRRYFLNILKLEDVLTYSQESNKTKNHGHDTVKPEKLTEDLIHATTRKGYIVFIPFAGSGTECAMSAKTGRRFIAYDVEKKYVDMANNRAGHYLKQGALF